MSVSPAEYAFLREAKSDAAQIQKILGSLVKVDALWNGSPSYNTAITQNDLDTTPDLATSGYTHAEISDALYALAVIKGVINDHIASLSRLADLQ